MAERLGARAAATVGESNGCQPLDLFRIGCAGWREASAGRAALADGLARAWSCAAVHARGGVLASRTFFCFVLPRVDGWRFDEGVLRRAGNAPQEIRSGSVRICGPTG